MVQKREFLFSFFFFFNPQSWKFFNIDFSEKGHSSWKRDRTVAHLSKFQAVQKVSKTWFTGNWSNDAERTSSTVWKTCQKARCGRWSCSTSSSLWYLGSAMNIFPQCAPWPGVCYCAGRLGPGREMVSLIPASLAQIDLTCPHALNIFQSQTTLFSFVFHFNQTWILFFIVGLFTIGMQITSYIICKVSVNFFCKGSASKYFSFRRSDSLSKLPLPLQRESSHRQYINEDCGCIPIKLFYGQLNWNFI